jgi:hypothetical protein
MTMVDGYAVWYVDGLVLLAIVWLTRDVVLVA